MRVLFRSWEIDDVTAYRTVRAAPPPAPVREAIKGGGFDAVCFTSSSTVRNLVGIAGKPHAKTVVAVRSEEHTSELQSRQYLVCRLLLEKKIKILIPPYFLLLPLLS